MTLRDFAGITISNRFQITAIQMISATVKINHSPALFLKSLQARFLAQKLQKNSPESSGGKIFIFS